MDAKIVELMKMKDFRGLELLINSYGEEIIKTINAVLNRTEEHNYHKEAENEVFYKIWRSIDQFDVSKSSLKTWSLTITRNSCIDKKRTIIRKQKLVPLEQAAESKIYDQYFEKEEFLDLICSLSSEDQLIFLKYYYYQETPQMIAEELQLPITQIYNHLSRGRKKLKKNLQEGVINHGEYF
ncbi:sigma-70 family RNA polymerase sigma factor [Enterococcus sp. BWT-B8]|uniref:sigma-70 family RNA polymerase sigma factor n=1 Tax=unclassified Enterococcus TaxID=2608891 RepID=UPI001E3361A0|nr:MULTISPECIES: sigma-70 family RNA polymerase sigma factor [unclassified Enterococcus]MCB5950770.1 sigma-70 family RNA polymerase sigma factor [Enterococcus sp. BWT-B8]MCB5955211.1 sigma-70 family RNA polymerase sigma factor [Enterococcus sp. CWB-B31]